MNRQVYLLDLDAYRAISRWCRRSPRREVGGVLGGVGHYIVVALRMRNTSNAPCSSFEWNDADVPKARRVLADLDLRLVGWWHSHPRGSARPSRHDVECQSGLELIWSGSQRQPRLWRLKGTKKQVLRNELGLLVGRSINGKALWCGHVR